MISEPNIRIGDSVRYQVGAESGTATITALDIGASITIVSIPLRLLTVNSIVTLSNGKVVNGLQITKV